MVLKSVKYTSSIPETKMWRWMAEEKGFACTSYGTLYYTKYFKQIFASIWTAALLIFLHITNLARHVGSTVTV